MRNIAFALLAQFEVGLRERAVPNSAHGSYKKWLRCYQKIVLSAGCWVLSRAMGSLLGPITHRYV